MGTAIEIKKEDYLRYIHSLECKQTKEHFASEFIYGHAKMEKIDNSIKVVNTILAEIRDQHEPIKLYEAYKKNKKMYREEIEDDIIKKGSIIESIKNIAILAIGAAGIILYIFQMHFK
jgi:hypothetical protein